MIGKNEYFPGWVATGDGTLVQIQKPGDGSESLYYKGNKAKHCVLFWTIIDANCRCRYLLSRPGTTSERTTFTASPLYQQRDAYFLPGQHLLWDTALQGDGPVMSPFKKSQIRNMSAGDRKIAQEYNELLAQQRIEVEWFLL